jgi:hypothetical protein
VNCEPIWVYVTQSDEGGIGIGAIGQYLGICALTVAQMLRETGINLDGNEKIATIDIGSPLR